MVWSVALLMAQPGLTLEPKVYRLDQLGAALSSAVGQPVRVAPQLANQTVFVGAGPWERSALQELIANQYQARWVEEDGTLRLTPDPIKREAARAVEMEALTQAWRTKPQLSIQTGPSQKPVIAESFGRTILGTLSAKDLLAIPVGGGHRFTSDPVPGQFRLPGGASHEAALYTELAKSYRVELPEGAARRPAFELRVNRDSAGSWSATGWVGQFFIFSAGFSAAEKGADAPAALASLPAPTWDTERLRLLGMSMDQFDPSTLAVLPQQGDFGAILNFEVRDPWQSLLGPALSQLPSRALVVLSDPAYSSTLQAVSTGKAGWKEIAPLVVHRWTQTGDALVGTPAFPTLSQEFQLDRAALQRLVRADRPAPQVNLGTLLAYARLNPEAHEPMLGPTTLTTFSYRRSLMNAGDDRLLGTVLRAIDQLSPDQLQLLMQGRVLAFRALPPGAQASLTQVLLNDPVTELEPDLPKSEGDRLLDSLNQIPDQAEMTPETRDSDSAGTAIRVTEEIPVAPTVEPSNEIPTIEMMEPAEILALRSGIPNTAFVRLRTRSGPAIQITDWGRIELEPLRFLTPVEASLMRTFMNQPELALISPILPKFDHAIPVERTELWLEVMLDERRGLRYRIDLSRPTGSRVPWGQLPSEFLTPYRRAEQMMGRLQDMMQGGSPPSDAPPSVH